MCQKFGCVLDESGADEAECLRKVSSRSMLTGAIMSLVNVWSLSVQSSRMSYCSCLFLFVAVIPDEGN